MRVDDLWGRICGKIFKEVKDEEFYKEISTKDLLID